MNNVLFIGCGNMGNAIIKGILKDKFLFPDNLFFYEVNKDLKKKIVDTHAIHPIDTIDASVKDYKCIILVVKPQVFNTFDHDKVMQNLGAQVTENQIVVSVMAGVKISKMKGFFINNPQIVRVMSNSPALIGEAMTVLSPDDTVTGENLQFVKNIFESIGKAEILEEKYLDAVTGLSGSGPAYVLTFIESLIQGGLLCGLPGPIAQKLAIQTVLGAARMIEESGNSIEELRHMVTSPGGTTIEALHSLEQNAFRATVAGAVRTAAEKSKELGKK